MTNWHMCVVCHEQRSERTFACAFHCYRPEVTTCGLTRRLLVKKESDTEMQIYAKKLFVGKEKQLDVKMQIYAENILLVKRKSARR